MSKPKHIYLINLNNTNLCKIGVAYHPSERLKQIQLLNPYELTILTSIRSNTPYKLERRLHKYYNQHNTKGEWFNLSQELIDRFEKNCKIIEKRLFIEYICMLNRDSNISDVANHTGRNYNDVKETYDFLYTKTYPR